MLMHFLCSGKSLHIIFITYVYVHWGCDVMECALVPQENYELKGSMYVETIQF